MVRVSRQGSYVHASGLSEEVLRLSRNSIRPAGDTDTGAGHTRGAAPHSLSPVMPSVSHERVSHEPTTTGRATSVPPPVEGEAIFDAAAARASHVCARRGPWRG